MKKFCRSHDIVARFGKDEIIILFHDTNEKRIINILDRLNKNIHYHDNSLQATISYGYAAKIDNHISVDEFIQIAEKRMINGKYLEGITLI
jgi:diguanylate cyclase (GGDEF)-like protein